MLGLDAYDSSSEDEAHITPSTKVQPHQSRASERPSQTSQNKDEPHDDGTSDAPRPSVTSLAAPSGPILGPASMHSAPSPEEHSTGGRNSPFSTSRALIQDLTLPAVPNLDIPPSPPGSPDATANAKFEHFLSLKKQGVHFNTKLASSSSLKNPSLLMKMMEHAGIDEQSQYDTSLPAELWSTSSLPPWAFKEELLRSQQALRRKMEDKNSSAQRSSIDFISESAATPT